MQRQWTGGPGGPDHDMILATKKSERDSITIPETSTVVGRKKGGAGGRKLKWGRVMCNL